MSVIVGDCVVAMAAMAEGSVDAIVCDPPYGLEFMGKEWDRLGGARIRQPSERDRTPGAGHNVTTSLVTRNAPDAYVAGPRMQAWHEAWAREALRVLKPGGHLLAFGGSRTYHRLMVGIEDAGFELRDCVMWLYGSGFPKSRNIAAVLQAIADDLARSWFVASHGTPAADGARSALEIEMPLLIQAPGEFDGWGTALKPGYEPIVVARKPLVGTVAGNVLAYGTGALNIDGCRIGFAGESDEMESKAKNRHADFESGARENRVYGTDTRARGEHGNYDASGRWPANVVLSHSEGCVLLGGHEVRSNGHSPASRGASGYGSAVEDSNGGGLKGQDGLVERRFDGELVEEWACVRGCPVRMLDDQAGDLVSGRLEPHHERAVPRLGASVYGRDAGDGASAGRSFGGDAGGPSRFFYCAKAGTAERSAGCDVARNPHPTVKPIDLMRWLVRLVTPPGGVVLDPFLGSGTTGCAAALEGFEFIGIERDEDYARVAEARIAFWQAHPTGMPAEAALEGWARRRKVADAGQLGLLDV